MWYNKYKYRIFLKARSSLDKETQTYKNVSMIMNNASLMNRGASKDRFIRVRVYAFHLIKVASLCFLTTRNSSCDGVELQRGMG